MSSYDQFVSDLQIWAENDDPQFIAEIPRIMRLVELELSRRLLHLDFYKSRDETKTTAAGTSDYDRPINLLTPLSLQATVGGKKIYLWERPLTFVDFYWPDSLLMASPPKYWANLSADRVRIAPTPNAAWPLTYFYTQTPLRLSETNQTNWMTENAYDLLFNLGMTYVGAYTKNKQEATDWRAMAEPLIRALGGTADEAHMDEASSHEPPPGR